MVQCCERKMGWWVGGVVGSPRHMCVPGGMRARQFNSTMGGPTPHVPRAHYVFPTMSPTSRCNTFPSCLCYKSVLTPCLPTLGTLAYLSSRACGTPATRIRCARASVGQKGAPQCSCAKPDLPPSAAAQLSQVCFHGCPHPPFPPADLTRGSYARHMPHTAWPGVMPPTSPPCPSLAQTRGTLSQFQPAARP